MSRLFVASMLCLFILVGAAFFFVLHWGSELPAPRPGTQNAFVSALQSLPPPTTVTVSEIKTKSGNIVSIQWTNLPGGTLALKIFRSLKGKNRWSLWETIAITSGELGAGSAQFNIRNGNYDFYTEAVGENKGSSTTSTLWAGTPEAPVATTSTTSSPSENLSATVPVSTTTTTTATTIQSLSSSSPTNQTATSTTPSGTPYYTPEVQISGYGQGPSSTFWVQHINQKIQMGWQNLPSITTSIVISRSTDANGPWSPMLTQENPASASGAYSLEVVDNTLGQSYYYKLDALAESTIVATYGPVYLPPIGS